MKKNAFFLITFIFITSCNQPVIEKIRTEVNKQVDQGISQKASIDSSVLGFNWSENRKRSLKLPVIENGDDGFVLRVWQDFDLPYGRLIIIQYADNIWSAEKCDYKYELKEDVSPDSLSGKFISLPQPKIGWESFVDKLVNMGILTLKDYSSIPNYDIASDELVFEVEFASNKYYRSYELLGIASKAGRIPQARKALKISSFINSSFSLPAHRSLP